MFVVSHGEPIISVVACVITISCVLHTCSVQWWTLEMLEKWQPAIIDALCVHIHDAQCINVTLPVAADMLYDQWRWVSQNGGDLQKDINMLIRTVSRRAYDLLMERESFRTLMKQEFEGYELTDDVERHKKKLHQFGDEFMLTREARSDRPAFCVTGYKSTIDEETDQEMEATTSTSEKKRLWYAYNAMGLPRQHEMQYSILSAWVT